MLPSKKNIASARAFLELPHFDTIVSICGLESKNDWHIWNDIEGNTINITKCKKIKITLNKCPVNCTKDVFRVARPSNIAKHSYWMLSLFGKSSKTYLCFLGNDGKLRVCYFEENKWKNNIVPLELGFQVLDFIGTGYIDIEPRMLTSLNSHTKLSFSEVFVIEEAWACGLPIEDTFLKQKLPSF